MTRQGRRRFGVVVIFALLLMLGSCAGVDLWAGRQVEAEIARLEKQYGPFDVISLTVPGVSAGDNRARTVRAAAALTVAASGGSLADLYTATNSFAKSPASPPVPAELQAFAEANRSAVQAAGDIRRRRQSGWEVDYLGGSGSPPWMDIRTLSHAIYVAAVLDLKAGQPDEAARAIVSGLGVSASIRQEPNLIAQLIRVATGAQQVEGLHRLVTQSEPSKASLQELAGWLAENRTSDPAQVALLGELKHGHAVLTRMENGQVDPNIGQYIYPETWPHVPPWWYGPMARLGRPVVRVAHARYLRQMAHLLEIHAGPRPRPAFPPTSTPPRWALADRLTDKFYAGIERTSETCDEFVSALGAAELAVALRRFRLDRGAYPDDLSALVPAYLASLPIDPYTGRPPVYARQAAGFTLRAKGSRPEAVGWWVLEWNVTK